MIELSQRAAEEAGLKYVADSEAGFKRHKRGRGFFYTDHEDVRISCAKTLHRITSLVIPPAWADVWICRHANGHLQATGRDVRTRKQYRYHALWSSSRNETKFDKLIQFSEALPRIRRAVERDLNSRLMDKRKVLAALIRTLEITSIRVGNDIYAEENESYGLTTLLNTHARVHGKEVRFKFRGKSGVLRDVKFTDPRVSQIVRRCQHLPGQELFEFVDREGRSHDINSSDVNHYLHEISGAAITAKDFRTWAATVDAAKTLVNLGPAPEISERARKKRELEVIRHAAEHLGNTTAVCRKYYVHPLLFTLDRSGTLPRLNRGLSGKNGRGDYSRAEKLVIKCLNYGATHSL